MQLWRRVNMSVWVDDFVHEKSCSFGPMTCPMPECHQVGVINIYSQHLLTKHDISFAVELYKSDYELYKGDYAALLQ